MKTETQKIENNDRETKISKDEVGQIVLEVVTALSNGERWEKIVNEMKKLGINLESNGRDDQIKRNPI